MIAGQQRRFAADVDPEDPQTQLTTIDVISAALEPILPDLGGLSSPDGAVTLMLSDIAGAADAAQALGEERWQQVLRDHRVLVEQLLAHHDGTIVRFEKDGFLASFNSAHGGLHAAVDLQRTFAGSAPGGDAGHPLAIRIGLHSGFVISNPDQLLGRNVVLAGRIAAQAKADEILVSSTLKQYTESDPSFSFEERGEHHFKGVVGEHQLFAVEWR